MRSYSFAWAALLLAAATPAAAQVSLSAGPQISTLGIGISAEVRITPLIGLNAEYNLLPLQSTNKSSFNNTLSVEPSLQGALVALTLHPGGGKFAIGGGLLAGGLSADAALSLDPATNAEVELGDGTYSSGSIGTLSGTLEYGTVQPAGFFGWTGKGFNFVLGAAVAAPTLTLGATGPIKSDAAFQADLAREIADFDDSAGKIPVYPYLRLGWQFGF